MFELNMLLPGLIPGLVPAALAFYRRRWVLGVIALVATINVGLLGGWILALPVALNFFVTAAVFPARRKRTATGGIQVTPGALIMIAAALALGVALLLPWMLDDDTSLNALAIFTDPPRAVDDEIPALIMIPIAALVGLLAGLGALLRPRDSRLPLVGLVAGVNALLYFVTYLMRMEWEFAEAFAMVGVGFWLGLAAALVLVAQFFLPRDAEPVAEETTYTTYKRSRARMYFLMPGVYWILTFTLFPLLYSLYMSFTNATLRNLTRGFDLVGFENYADIFTDNRVVGLNPIFAENHVLGAIEISVFMSILSLVITLAAGTFVAWLFNHDLPGLRAFRSILTMPMFAAPIALGFLGLILFNENSGPINHALRGVGLEGVSWMTNPWSARIAVVLLDSWQWTPFVFIIVLAAMQSIPEELYEAARLDTASAWMLFRKITFPLIAPALGTVALLRLVETFKILDIPLSMLGGGPGAATQTYSYYIYVTGLKDFDMGYASALSYLLVIVAIVISSIYFWRVRERFA